MAKGSGGGGGMASSLMSAGVITLGLLLFTSFFHSGNSSSSAQRSSDTSQVSTQEGNESPSPESSPQSNGDIAVVGEANGTAATALNSLPVKGRAAKTGYSRSQFGPSWKDVDKNGCDTRNDILIRDLVERQMSGDCKVMSGVLYPDPYTNKKIVFTYGKSLIDIDHVVALGDVWVKGGQQLSATQRTAIANDPMNLLAVDYSANRQKGDGDAATWLPSNKEYRCTYVSMQIAVKAKYHLWVTQAEKDAMASVLSSCPNQKLPVTPAA